MRMKRALSISRFALPAIGLVTLFALFQFSGRFEQGVLAAQGRINTNVPDLIPKYPHTHYSDSDTHFDDSATHSFFTQMHAPSTTIHRVSSIAHFANTDWEDFSNK